MAYLMRKINLPKWQQESNHIEKAEDINAETLSDLCAENNDISTWYVGEKSSEEIKKAVLALASGFRTLDELQIVFLDIKDLNDAGFQIKETDGLTKIEEYKGLHRDIENLNAGKLIELAAIILKQIEKNEIQSINVNEIAMGLLNLIDKGKIIFDNLDKGLKSGFAGRAKKIINSQNIKLEDLNPVLQKSLKNQWQINQKKTNCRYEAECSFYK